MKNRLKILFDKSNSTFSAGDLITGRVIIQKTSRFEEFDNGNQILITWNGKQHVFWETHKPTSMEKRVGPLPKKKLPGDRPSETDTLIYFRTSQILTDFLEMKTHFEYKFLFKVPVECMPNVKGKYGGIAYWVTVQIKNGDKLSKEVAKGFNVLPYLDRPFTSNFLSLTPCKLVQRESGAIFKDGSYSMQISLPKRHYFRGELLSSTVLFTNSSTKPITNFTIQLIQKIHYHANQKLSICHDQKTHSCQLYRNLRRNEKITVLERKFSVKIDPGQSFEETFEIEVPRKAIPTFESPLISAGYFLSFSCRTNSVFAVFNKLQANLGITVGGHKSKVNFLDIPKIIETFDDLSCSPPPSYHSECPSFHEKIE